MAEFISDKQNKAATHLLNQAFSFLKGCIPHGFQH
jgi:hypothetical protein